MENTADYKKPSLLYGTIFGIYSSLLLYFNFNYKFDNTTLMSLASFAIAVLLVYYPIHQYKQNNEGFLKIPDALKIGLIVGLIGGIIYAIYTYYHYTQVDTEFISQTIAEANKALDSDGNLTKEDLNTSKELITSMVSPSTFATLALIGMLLKTFVISLVVGLIKKS